MAYTAATGVVGRQGKHDRQIDDSQAVHPVHPQLAALGDRSVAHDRRYTM